MILLAAIVAVIGGAVWTLLDRRRAHDDRLRAILRVLLRYTLGFIIISYGLAKVFLGQFSPPSPARLFQRYGDSSPMGLMWTFMGASPGYVFFSGFMETVGAVLMFWRRTTTLGALVLVGVLTNVVLMNFCYDVPVKINSSHYLVMALILLLPMASRIADVVLFGRPTQPLPPDPVPSRRVRVIGLVIKYLAIVFVVGMNLKDSVTAMRDRGAGIETWYSGYWRVDKLVRDGHEIAPSDPTRWERMKFEVEADAILVRWRLASGAYAPLYKVTLDETAHTFTLAFDDHNGDTLEPPNVASMVLHYLRVDDEHVTLTGNDGLVVELVRLRADKTVLMTRGFHWINEVPYNR